MEIVEPEPHLDYTELTVDFGAAASPPGHWVEATAAVAAATAAVAAAEAAEAAAMNIEPIPKWASGFSAEALVSNDGLGFEPEIELEHTRRTRSTRKRIDFTNPTVVNNTTHS